MAPEVYIGATWDSVAKTTRGGATTPLPVDGGYAKFTARPGSEGEQKWSGVIKVKKPDGTYDGYPFQASYVAQKPNSVVSAEKMNVLYIGVENPMAISVPGVPNNQVHVSIEGAGGSLSPNAAGGAGHYIAKVTTTGECKIKVSAEIGGKTMPMGEFKYRVKRVPDPIVIISNSKGGPIAKNLLKAGVLIPQLEGFDFELFFKITSYKATVIPRGKDPLEFNSDNNTLPEGLKNAIEKAKAGDRVIFEYIKAKMANNPNDPTRSLAGVSFTIQ
ncbi:MAG: GldM family protein [Bacteroidia bacterium]